jgi:hypothetical protein
VSVDQLLEVVGRQHAQLGTTEVAAALATVSQLSRNAAGRPLDDRRMYTLLERARDCLANATAVDPRDLVDIARSLATLNLRDALPRSVWKSMQARAQRLTDAFSIRQACQLAWASSRAPVPTGELMGALATLAEPGVSELTQARDIAALAYAFAKAAVPAHGLLAAIAGPAEQRLSTFSAQALANTAWAIAKAHVRAPGLFAALAVHAKQRLGTFKVQELANTAWAFASAGESAPRLFAALAMQCEQRLGTFNAQELANTTWVFASAGESAPRLFAALAMHSEQRAGTFNAQELANTAWAFASAGVRAPELFDALAVHSKQRMGTFNARDLARTVWAFATAGVRAQGLFAALAVHCARHKRMGTFHAPELASTTWAFATAGVPPLRLSAALAVHSQELMGTFKAQNLASTAWTFATMSMYALVLFAVLAVHSEQRMGTFNARELANTAWAFATSGVFAPELLAALAVHSQEHMGTFNAQGLANTAWAFATVGLRAQGLFDALAMHSEQRMGTFNAQEFTDAAWAFAAMYVLDAPAKPTSESTAAADAFAALHPWLRLVVSMAELYLESAQADESGQLSKHVCALRLALLVCHTAQGGTSDPRFGRLRAAARARSLALDEVKAAVTPLAARLELSARLRAAGWGHADEVSLEGGLLVVDMACTVTHVVVEFDGPSHYQSQVQSNEEIYSGRTLFKAKLLEMLGWRVHRSGRLEGMGMGRHGGRPQRTVVSACAYTSPGGRRACSALLALAGSVRACLVHAPGLRSLRFDGSFHSLVQLISPAVATCTCMCAAVDACTVRALWHSGFSGHRPGSSLVAARDRSGVANWPWARACRTMGLGMAHPCRGASHFGLIVLLDAGSGDDERL